MSPVAVTAALRSPNVVVWQVMRSFVAKADAGAVQGHWADLMYESLEKKYGRDPRDDSSQSEAGSSHQNFGVTSQNFLHIGDEIIAGATLRHCLSLVFHCLSSLRQCLSLW